MKERNIDAEIASRIQLYTASSIATSNALSVDEPSLDSCLDSVANNAEVQTDSTREKLSDAEEIRRKRQQVRIIKISSLVFFILQSNLRNGNEKMNTFKSY